MLQRFRQLSNARINKVRREGFVYISLQFSSVLSASCVDSAKIPLSADCARRKCVFCKRRSSKRSTEVKFSGELNLVHHQVGTDCVFDNCVVSGICPPVNGFRPSIRPSLNKFFLGVGKMSPIVGKQSALLVSRKILFPLALILPELSREICSPANGFILPNSGRNLLNNRRILLEIPVGFRPPVNRFLLLILAKNSVNRCRFK